MEQMSKSQPEADSITVIIDTSLGGAQVSVVKSSAVLSAEIETVSISDNSAVSKGLPKAFEKLGVVPEELDRILVSKGPGSFTGIRIGLAFASGVAAGVKPEVQVIGFSALVAVAKSLKSRLSEEQGVALISRSTSNHGYIVVVNDAGVTTQQVLDLRYGVKCDDGWRPLSERISKVSKVFMVSSWDEAAKAFECLGHIVETIPQHERSFALTDGVINNFCDWQGSNPIVAPDYLRLSTAEEKLVENSI